MNKFEILVIVLVLQMTAGNVFAENDRHKVLYDLAGKSKNWMEGFQKNTGENTFSYHTFRNDVTDGLITRCSNGQMAIEWETQPLSANYSEPNAGFLWIASINLTTDKNIFDVFVNGTKRFEIPASMNREWEITTPEGGKLAFTVVNTDDQQGAHGYMSMIAPVSWLNKGSVQKIGITGRANKNTDWLIVFQATDAIANLQNSVKYNIRVKMTMEEKNGSLECLLQAPDYLTGNELSLTTSGKTRKINLNQGTSNSEATFTLPLSAKNHPLKINDPEGELISVSSLGEVTRHTLLLNKAVLNNNCKISDKKITVDAHRIYYPATVSDLLKLSGSILGKGQILLMNSSHQDIAWMDSPEKCVIERDTMLITPLLKMAEKDKNYHFDIEDALMIREYTQRHPDKKPLLRQMFSDGRIAAGSGFIQPYEEMYSGESLARMFYFGTKWLKDEFNYDATVYWNEDVPGRTLQMPQIMRKAGTKYMMISRIKRGIFNWYSPDGSYITVFSPGHYGDAFGSLGKNFPEAAQYIATSSMYWQKFYNPKTASPVIPILSDNDMSPSKDYSQLISNWENIRELPGGQGKNVPVTLPKFKIASAPEFFKILLDQKPELPKIIGERPAVWLYIHGPSHQKALKASREADILLPVAEKLSTINALIDASFANYPQERLNKAWEAKIYPDHGWGGKHGDITDDWFHSKYEFAKAEAEKIVNQNLNELASKIKTDSHKGTPLVVFNSINELRSDKVCTRLSFDKAEAFGLELADGSGKEVKSQLTSASYFQDGSLKSATLQFIAENIPSIGYRTFFLHPLKKSEPKSLPAFEKKTENRFYRLTFADGGLSSIYDKELNQELVDPAKFKAGEIFTMHSEGNGAGEFSDIQKPDMKDFDKTGNYPTKWEIEEDGPVFTCYKYRQPIKYAVVEQRIKLFHGQKRIDFETQLLNWEGVLYHEFRMALPLNMTDGKVAYEVPFGVVEVGKDEIDGAAGERYQTECKNIHPRGIQNWISSGNAGFGVTLSSSVAVADWIDPTDQPVKNQVLQPILLASRKSCHWEGNEYLQTGDHSFSFSMTSHKPGWQNGALFGRESNEKLMAVKQVRRFEKASLPETLSFLKTNQSNVEISTFKKGEDTNQAVIRMVERSGKDQDIILESFKGFSQAQHTNLVESNQQPITLTGKTIAIKLGHNAIETIKTE